MTRVFDAYILRARLGPALIAVMPIIATLVFFLGDRLSWGQSIWLGVMGALIFAVSDLARRRGKQIEREIFKANDGRPFATVLRHRDTEIDPVLKARFHTWLGDQLGEEPPTSQDEAADKAAADRFYARCTALLRERTRNHEEFRMVFEENVTYGFRRNLYGLKPVALAQDALLIAASIAVILDVVPLDAGQEGFGIYGVLAVALLHGIYFLFPVSKRSVLAASDEYARQLVMGCDRLSS